MNPRLLLGLCALLLTGSCSAAPQSRATYDQRQDGQVNVQVDIKDVQILALIDPDSMDDYVNYDYAYDYSDFTIKPPSSKPTTKKPSTTTSAKPSIADTDIASPATTAAQASADSSSTKAPEASTVPSETSEITVQITHVEDSSMPVDNKLLVHVSNSTTASSVEPTKTEEQKEQKEQQLVSLTSTTAVSTNATSDNKPDGTKRPLGMAEPRKRCPVGFLLKSGRCFKRRLSLISPRRALFKLAPTFLNGLPTMNEQTTASS